MEQDGVSDFMMPKKLIIGVVLLLLALYATLSFARTTIRGLTEYSFIDFHAYWYSGHFVIQRSDPYEAFFQGREPNLPIHYIDGYTASSYPVGQPDLSRTPANTAPIVLFMSLFSLFSWPTAKVLWLFLNLSLALAIPWLAIRLWPSTASNGDNLNKLLIFSLLLSLVSIRYTIAVGQTSILIFFLMLLAILTVNKNRIVSSLSLGFALSKYSLSIPIIFWFLFKKRYEVVLLSFLTQIVGIVVLSLITETSPLQILYEYYRMLLLHLDKPGVNITYALQIPALSPLSFLLLLIQTSAVIIPTATWVFRYYNAYAGDKQKIIDLHLLNILNVWNLLSFYHRVYDMIIMVLLIVLFVYGMSNNIWYLSNKKGFLYLMALISFWLIIPHYTIVSFLANQFGLDSIILDSIFIQLNTPILLLCLPLLIALLYRINPPAAMQSLTKDATPIQTEREAL